MSRVIDSNGVFDYEAYRAYSPIFLPTSFAICFGVAFALLTCLPVYTILFHGHQIRAAITGQNTYDIHQRLMRRYRDVPKWWYALILLVCFGIAVGSAERYETGFPAWAIFLAFILAGGFVIPVSIVMATSNQNVNMLWALGEIIAYVPSCPKPEQHVTDIESAVDSSYAAGPSSTRALNTSSTRASRRPCPLAPT